MAAAARPILIMLTAPPRLVRRWFLCFLAPSSSAPQKLDAAAWKSQPKSIGDGVFLTQMGAFS